MFRVDNLVFNKIGNSLSVMIFCDDKGLQIWDETDFIVLSHVFSLKGLYLKEFLTFFFEITYNDKKTEGELLLSDKNSTLKIGENIFSVKIEDEKLLIDIDNPNLLFNLSMKNLDNIKVNNGFIEISEKNLFKNILKLFVEMKSIS